MEKCGFSTGFIAKMKVLYSKVESVLKFNVCGFCGVLLVCVEVSGRALLGPGCSMRSTGTPPQQGLPGFNENIVLCAYADDVIVFTRNRRDVDITTIVISDFTATSATRVNWRKSEALAVHEWHGGLPVLPQNLTWRTDGLKYIGIFLGKEIIVQ